MRAFRTERFWVRTRNSARTGPGRFPGLATAAFLGCALFAAAAFLGCRSMYLQPEDVAGTDFLNTGTTSSFFRAIQVDPRAEDAAGPQFAALGDFNNDGLPDVASGWNESQPVQVHVQQRLSDGTLQFATLPVGGTTPIARISGLKVADLDLDGFADIVVLVKDTGEIAHCDYSRPDCDVTCNPSIEDCGSVTDIGGWMEDALAGSIVVFFNPKITTADTNLFTEPWVGITLTQSVLAGVDEGDLPEEGGYTSLDVGDIDGINGPDIVAALNSAEGEPTDTVPPQNTISLYPNPGGASARNPEGWSRTVIYGDAPRVRDCRIADLDGDGDRDVVVTFPQAKSSNIRWLPNPLSYGGQVPVYGYWPYSAPIGQVATEADIVELGDVDNDGATDILVRSRNGMIVQWFRKPDSPSQTFLRNPWPVYTLAEFASRAPGAIAIGDLNGDGQLDAAIAAGGAVAWLEPPSSGPYDQWVEHIIIDDSPDETTTAAAPTTGTGTPASGTTTTPTPTPVVISTDPNAAAGAVGGTLVNTLLIADIDGDGLNDILVTLDRTTLSGLSSDALALLRNTRGD